MDVPLVKSEFQIEIEILRRLKHPNIISVLGWGVQRGRIFIVLEPLDEVGDNMNTAFPFYTPEAIFNRGLHLCKQLACAISFLHHHLHPDASVIHRDLKMQNIGVGADKNLKLFDFGLAKCVRKRVTETEAYDMTGGTGTLRFMPPEVAMYKPYNEKVDVFSFAILMWAIITKQIPFKGFDRATHYERVMVGGERPPLEDNWPEWLKNLLTRAWHTDPLMRPSMCQVYEIMEKCVPAYVEQQVQKTRNNSVFCCAWNKSETVRPTEMF